MITGYCVIGSNSFNGGIKINSCSLTKFPKLNSPKFSGEIENWLEFFNCLTRPYTRINHSKVEKMLI